MREWSVPSSVPSPRQHGTADFVFDNAAAFPDRVALRRRIEGEWVDVTSAQFADEVVALAKGLLAAGVGTGDRVALMSRTRYEWTLADFAVLSLGAVVVPIYETSSAEQVTWILTNAAVKTIVVETTEHEALVESVRASAPDLGKVWTIDSGAIAALSELGAHLPDSEVHKRRDAVVLDDLASILYTSGTTGKPKGCKLIHRNFVTEINEVVAELPELLNPQTLTLLFIPIAHVFGRVIEIGALAAGCTLGHSPDVKNLLADLGEYRPTFILSVPRVFEKVYNTAKQRAHAEGHGRIFDAAERIAIKYSQATERGSAPLGLRAQHWVFERLVYRKLRAALGSRCVAAISGGAPLGARLGHYFRGVGITVYEGYGLTETTAGICVNRPEALRIGTVGQLVGGTSARVADDGELLFKSNLIFAGYWRNDAATAEAIDEDGWFHTGDLGSIDEDGFVTITGRKKELIVTAGGKNVAPTLLEDGVRAHWLVSQCLVVGDRQPFVAALVTVDPEAFPQWLEQAGRPPETPVADMVDDPELRAEIQVAIDDANAMVSKAESIRKFAILPVDWTEATGELTPSLKLKRNLVQNQCADEIAALYRS